MTKVKTEFEKAKEKYMQKLRVHPNELARSLQNVGTFSRLRRTDIPPVE